MSLELELWAMNSARISALEAGGGGSSSDLCIRVPKFDWNYLYDHEDEVIAINMDYENDYAWTADFTVPDDGKVHYALLMNNAGFGIPGAVIVIESCGGQILNGDDVGITETIHHEGYADHIPVYSCSIHSNHQTILYDPDREDNTAKSYSIAYNDTTYNNPILLKNGSNYQLRYGKNIEVDIEDPEKEEALYEIRKIIGESTSLMIVPGTYEEIPVVVRNGGNT